MIVIFSFIIIIAVVVSLLITPTFESEALIQIGTYQNNPIESTNDLNAVMYSEPILEQLNKILGLNSVPAILTGVFDITQKKSDEKDGVSNYLQIKGRGETPEKAKTVVVAVRELIIARHNKLFDEALNKFNLEVELIKRDQQLTETTVKQKELALARTEKDINYYEGEIQKRADADSEGQGRIVESYINLLATAKTQKETRVIEIENLKQELENFDFKFQEKAFERKYQTKPTTVEISASLPQTKIAPDRRKNVIISAVLAAFLAVLYAFAAEFVSQHKSEFKNSKKKEDEIHDQPTPPTICNFT